MSLVTACIRPSGASYRDDLLAHKIHKNPSELIDNLLMENNGFLTYQEDVIAFLQQICGLSGSAADGIRRAIARKKREVLDKAMPDILKGYCARSAEPKEKAEAEAREFLQIIEDASSYMFGKNHSIAYCLLGYLCAYYRYYYPIEFITSFLNNAANEEDIYSGTKYAGSVGIKVTMPKWGLSKSDYFFDKKKNIIAKGLSSVKYISARLAEELYALAHGKNYSRFVDVLDDINSKTSTDRNQLDILIKIDFFSDFGNQRELLRIADMFYEMFKRGQAKKISRSKIEGTPFEPAVAKYSVGVTKSGSVAKSCTLLDITSVMRECEDLIKAQNMNDLSDLTKVRNFAEVMGYAGYVSGKEEDRRKLYVTDVYPLVRRKDGKQFGYSVLTKSIGSGKESRFTVLNKVYNNDPIRKGDIVFCKNFIREGQYFKMTDYFKIC